MRMPVLFVGHGTPMNAIEDNTFTDTWVRLGETIRDTFDPRALVVISAHWEAEAHFVTGDEQPRQIYDMYGFPRALYELRYDAQADPRLAPDSRTLRRPSRFSLGNRSRQLVGAVPHVSGGGPAGAADFDPPGRGL